MVNKTPLILFKKLFRMVKDNFKQFLSIIAISFLAICLFAGLTSNAKNLENRANKVYSESNFADIYVTTTSNKNVDYDSIKNIDGVEKVERRSYIPVKFLNKSINVIIEEDNVRLIQLLDIIRAFDKNSFAARAAYSAEESERNAYDKRARTTDDEEGESPFDPFAP